MLPKLYIGLSLVLGIGIGRFLNSAIAFLASKHGNPHAAHGTSADAGHGAGETRVQVSRSGIVQMVYPPDAAIWLFSAEGEKLWLADAGWNPAILRGDGFGRNDVFALHDTTFITVTFDAEGGVAEYARVQDGMSAGIVKVGLRADGAGSVAEVSYDMTALGEAGDEALAAMTDEAFASMMSDWQAAIKANDDAIRAWLSART